MTDEIKNQDELVEFKASGEASEVPDPVATTAKKRMADKSAAGEKADEVEDKVNKVAGDLITTKGKKAPARMADKAMAEKMHKSMKESSDQLFSEEDLSEEFKEKAATIFEAAVIERVNQEIAIIEEEKAAEFAAAVETAKQELEENVDTYLNYVVEQWVQENKIAIESGIKAEIAEDFLAGLKDLFEEHYVEIPEDKVDVAEELATRVAELEEELGAAVERNAELSEEIEEKHMERVFAEVASDMSMTQREKLLGLAEGITFTSIDEYRTKLETIKESYVNVKKAGEAEEQLNEEYEGQESNDDVLNVDAQMAAYMQAVTRSIKK